MAGKRNPKNESSRQQRFASHRVVSYITSPLPSDWSNLYTIPRSYGVSDMMREQTNPDISSILQHLRKSCAMLCMNIIVFSSVSSSSTVAEESLLPSFLLFSLVSSLLFEEVVSSSKSSISTKKCCPLCVTQHEHDLRSIVDVNCPRVRIKNVRTAPLLVLVLLLSSLEVVLFSLARDCCCSFAEDVAPFTTDRTCDTASDWSSNDNGEPMMEFRSAMRR